MSEWRRLQERELGLVAPLRHACLVRRNRARSVELSKNKDFATSNRGAINSLQIDAVESRYLLAGASDASVAAYDVLQPTLVEGSSEKYEPLFSIGKNTVESSHKFSVSSVHWYPVDTGMFVTGSFDNKVNVWDTNTLEVLLQFKLPGKVHAVSMSPVASTHMLVAAGTDDYRVRLCDLGSGAFTQTLTGHRDGVWSVKWSATSEWIVITGGCDGAIRFWDIRRAGCFFLLDQHLSQINSGTGTAEQDTAGSNGSQRGHPGLASDSDRSTAHYGAVTALETTPDGHYLLSAGADSRVRLWDLNSGCNTLVNYEATRVSGNKRSEIAVSMDASLVCVPCVSLVHVYDIWSGRLFKTLKGHLDLVNCCVYHTDTQELYSGSHDRQVLVWSPRTEALEEEQDKTSPKVSATKKSTIVRADEDYWSD